MSSEEEKLNIFEKFATYVLRSLAPNTRHRVRGTCWVIFFLLWLLAVHVVVFVVLFWYFYNDCQLNAVSVDASTISSSLFDPSNGNYLCSSFIGYLVPCVLPGYNTTKSYGKRAAHQCLGGVHYDPKTSCLMGKFDKGVEDLNYFGPNFFFNSIYGDAVELSIGEPLTSVEYLTCQPVSQVLV